MEKENQENSQQDIYTLFFNSRNFFHVHRRVIYKCIQEKLRKHCSEFRKSNILKRKQVRVILSMKSRVPKNLHTCLLNDMEELGLIKQLNKADVEIM